ncbi:MAG: hypothetical protein PHT33_01060 [bacterium]|nr:hypothetical protein [bacterium]
MYGMDKYLQIACLYDRHSKEEANRAGWNYWAAYQQEIFSQLGASAVRFEAADLTEAALSRLQVLSIGDTAIRDAGVVQAITDWVSRGGLLVGYAVPELDHLFGNTHHSDIKQQPDDYTISGYLSFSSHKLTQGLHSPVQPDQPLLICSDIRAVIPDSSEEVAGMFIGGKKVASAITVNRYGQGRAVYFAFDLPKTFWVLQHGRPVYKVDDSSRHKDKWWLRTPQKSIIRGHSPATGYTDELLFLLQNIIAQAGCPLIHQIPPDGDTIPVALFHWAGDDDGDVTGIQLKASDWMAAKGLPYHINVMETEAGIIPLSKEDAVKILSNGHELSCHYNFLLDNGREQASSQENPYKVGQAETARQTEHFKEKFGLKPLAGANHCLIWYGGSEPARWMQSQGGIASNNNLLSSDRHINGSSLNFGFGTAYPYHYYEDTDHGNERLEFIEIPITGYELGHNLSIDDSNTEIKTGEVQAAADIAVYCHLTFNMFYHPHYISREGPARQAIEEFLRYIEEKKLKVIHLGTNELAAWWHD